MKTHVEPFALAMLLANAFPALAATHYVDLTSTNATPPYTNWITAATNIQDAVDAAVAGDEIVVTNGVYAGGGRGDPTSAYSRVVVDKPLSLRSVNGPEVTAIDGERWVRPVRCAYLTNGATLSGFTLTNGLAQSYGGGAFCESIAAVITNCVLAGNYGGGAYGGLLNNCSLSNNSTVFGGGAAYCTLNNCSLSGNSADEGGGAAYCTLNNCSLSRNSTVFGGGGGGAAYCTLNNCMLTGNTAYGFGGGAADCTLNNCAVSGNSAVGYYNLGYYLSSLGGGTYVSSLMNCTVTGNSADQGGARGGRGGSLYNCILFGNTNGLGCEDCGSPGSLAVDNNWFGDPLFVDTNGWANLRLQSNSPCINAGNNAFAPAGPDLDGNPRIAGGTVDIGAYEFQAPVSQISYAWLQQFGLPINAATDAADPDGDGVDNWHEWLSGTDPTNRVSSPARLTLLATGTNVLVTWPTNAVGFTLQSATNLGSAAVWVTNSPASVVSGGQNVVTNPVTGPHQFYRLVH